MDLFQNFAFNEMLHSTHNVPSILRRKNVVFIKLYTSSTFSSPDWLLFSFSFKAFSKRERERKATGIDTIMAFYQASARRSFS